ncbi:hypothetical protein BLA60_40955 [Actinophytocola xinjiangensis]|uniref:Carrier domain-containing protein n=1 Tax=Actinophytocola xinjiangensis TaxID=485602 RepID=A0A7Z1AT47_9PSEU|nr:non-ribosomal peptide synthetase [Actinophytocola xinjiangensis]OLF04418.1 hypothetical protein BLA60_40955 [Actinophytocola xinjiangensis]
MSRSTTSDHHGCVHELVNARIGRATDEIAFRAGGTDVGYRELGERANRLAHLLRRRGVSTGDRVGVCLHRGPDLVVALLAVLNAGGCYVPLDPTYPPDRVAFMAKDSGASLVLTDTDGHFGGAQPVRLDDLDTSGEPVHPPPVRVSPRDLAYLIYTSGSTGRPKGVAIEHRSAVARLRWAGDTFSARELGGMLASTSVCFDLSVFEIFAPLAWGGRFVLVRDVLELATLPPGAGVRLVNTVPSAMTELLAADAVPDGVETVCLAGEPVPPALAERLWRRPGIARVLNLYGPSEDTTYSTVAELTRHDTGPPPIGRPLPGTTAHVLDDAWRPAGTGELYLAGEGLARGYFAWPAETAARFLPDPFGRPGTRLYRTGDRVRRRADGRLEYLGRTDDQVKIRGHRVELGEVAAALATVAGVHHASARAVRGPAGDLRLAGYVVADGTRPDTARVLADLRERVPAPLVPSTLVWLDRLPRTPNGKVDRRALPDPVWDRPNGGVNSDTDTVAAVWQEVLGVRPEPGDDFFASGGDSLLATRVVARLRAALGVSLPLTALFDRPTAAGLSALVRAASATRPPPAVSAGSPVSHAQQRLWFLDQLTPDDPAYLVNAVIWTRFAADPDHLTGALRDVVARHDALRTSFGENAEGDLTHHVHPAVDVPVERVALAADEDPHRLAARARPLDLTTAPLARFHLLTRDGRVAGVLLTVHHIVFDTWSLDVLVGDLGRCYDARAHGTAPPPATGDARGFGARQRTWLSGVDGQAALARLAGSLRGVPDTLDLPTDRPRPAEQGSAGAHLVAPVPGAAALTDHARRHATTRYLVGLTAFARLLTEWTGRRDLVVGTAFAGRTSAETQDAVGCFVNLVPLVIRTPPERAGLAAEVRRAALFAAGHQDVPFECVVERVRPPRRLDRPPLVQVAFGVHTATRSGYRGEPARLWGQELEPAHARLDLTLWLRERPDGLDALWTYRTALFVPATIAALHERYTALLAELTEPAAKES